MIRYKWNINDTISLKYDIKKRLDEIENYLFEL